MRQHILSVSFVLSALVLSTGCSSGGYTIEDDSSTADALVSSSANARTAFQYFVGVGLSEIQAAAIVGNLQQESSINPRSVQPGGPGRGIAQWSNGARYNASARDNLVWYAGQHGGNAQSLDTQLAFIWYELQTFPHYGLASLQQATTLATAVHAFQQHFEVCGRCNEPRRLQYAQEALNAFGGGGGGGGGGAATGKGGAAGDDDGTGTGKGGDGDTGDDGTGTGTGKGGGDTGDTSGSAGGGKNPGK